MSPALSEFVRTFARIGLLSFGGPAAQIALMHRELVDKRGWLSEESFLRALSLCMLLPGPEAMQLATYAGWRLRGTWGGLVAGLLFVLPGAAVILCLAVLYARFGQLPLVQAAFVGVQAAVIVIVLQALMKVAAKALGSAAAWALAAFAFLALFVVGLPYPLVILAAALFGSVFLIAPTRAPPTGSSAPAHPLRTLAIWLTLWLCPIFALSFIDQGFLTQIALFFSKLAVVTFGGAYAVLAYMTQTVVSDFGWITTDQMIDALGLAETTPGPLILVTQFVAMLAGFEQAGLGLALAAGAITLWVTFTPCFLWIFLAGPYLDKISERPRVEAALRGITAAVVGVIFNLAIWFAIHVLFAEVQTTRVFAAPLPVVQSFDPRALALTALAALWMIKLKRGMLETLVLAACVGLGLAQL